MKAIEAVFARFSVLAATFSAYDPDVDERIPDIVAGLIETVALSATHEHHERHSVSTALGSSNN